MVIYAILLLAGGSFLIYRVFAYGQKMDSLAIEELEEHGDRLSSGMDKVLSETKMLFSDNKYVQKLAYYVDNTKNWDEIYASWDDMKRSQLLLNASDVLWMAYNDQTLHTGKIVDLEVEYDIKDRIKDIQANTNLSYGDSTIVAGSMVYRTFFFKKGGIIMAGLFNLTDQIPQDKSFGNALFCRNKQRYVILVDGICCFTGDSEDNAKLQSFLTGSSLKEGRNYLGEYLVFYHALPGKNIALISCEELSIWDFISIWHLWVALVIGLFACQGYRLYLTLRKKMLDPLAEMTDSMKRIQAGDRTIFQNDSNIEEIEEVKNSIETMTKEIISWQAKSYEEQLERQAAQMQYLMLQLTPHFYLNCLKNTNAFLMAQKYEEAQDYLYYVSVHFQYLLKNSMELVAVKNELKFTDNYLRMVGCEKQVEYEVSPELIDYNIPMLSIQGIVENSIKYAWDDRDKIRISIQIHHFKTEEGEYLNLIIRDNGKGYPEDMLQLINSQNPKNNGDHVGIINLRRRLGLLYGSAASCYFENHNGAVSDILIPLKQIEDNVYEDIDR